LGTRAHPKKSKKPQKKKKTTKKTNNKNGTIHVCPRSPLWEEKKHGCNIKNSQHKGTTFAGKGMNQGGDKEAEDF